VPLLKYSAHTHSLADCATALKGLKVLRRFPVAAAATNASNVATLSSPAARCAEDALCIAFSYLPVNDFLVAQRVCRSWHTVRLQPAAWPRDGESAAVQAELLRMDDSLPTDAQLQILRDLYAKFESGNVPYLPRVTMTALQHMVHLLRSSDVEMQDQVAQTLTTIVEESTPYHHDVLRAGVMSPLLELCEKQDTSLLLLRRLTFLLRNLCGSSSQSHSGFSLVPALLVLAQLLSSSTDNEVLVNVCWGLTKLSSHDKIPQHTRIQAIIHSGVTARLVQLLQDGSEAVQDSALRTLGNLVMGNSAQTQVVLNCNVLPILLTLLAHAKPVIRKKACWTISNIAVEGETQISAIINAGIIPALLHILSGDDELVVRIEAVWFVSTVGSKGSVAHIRYLVEHGVIPHLCHLLTCTDLEVIGLVVEGLKSILKVQTKANEYVTMIEECGGLCSIKQLQHHTNAAIRHKVSILNTYFLHPICLQTTWR
jgi:hypothetical protein